MVRRRERKLGRGRDQSVGQRFRGRGGEERRGMKVRGEGQGEPRSTVVAVGGHLEWKRKGKEKVNGKMGGVPQKWLVEVYALLDIQIQCHFSIVCLLYRQSLPFSTFINKNTLETGKKRLVEKEGGWEGKWEEGRRKLAWLEVLACGQVPPCLRSTQTLVHILLLLLSAWVLGPLLVPRPCPLTALVYASVLHLTTQLINLGKKVFLFLSHHSFGLTAPLLCFGWSCLSCITWYMPIESVLIWNRFRKKLFCHLYMPKYYMSLKAEEKYFASIFLLYYVFH